MLYITVVYGDRWCDSVCLCVHISFNVCAGLFLVRYYFVLFCVYLVYQYQSDFLKHHRTKYRECQREEKQRQLVADTPYSITLHGEILDFQ